MKTLSAFKPALLAAACLFLPTASSADEEAAKAWATVPQPLERIVPPVFPDRDFLITRHGAEAGGEKNCKAAFDAAILA